MKRWSGAQFWRAMEFAYAILALFALTQGPVYRLWSQSALTIDRLPNPTLPHVYFATFVGLQLPAFALWFRRLHRGWFQNRAFVFLSLLVGWLALSAFWSTFARQTVPEVITLASTTVFGLYLASSFTARQFWLVVSAGMALGVGFSWLAVMRLWDGAVNFQQEYWIGIYFNRNSLAPVTATAIVAAIGLMAVTYERFRAKPKSVEMAISLGSVLLATYAGIELWHSKSQTSPVALLVATGIVIVWLISCRALPKSLLSAGRSSYVAPITVLLAGLILFVALQFADGFHGLSSETITLNSRRGLWSLSWSGVLEKPWFGWGWMAAWKTEEFFSNRTWWISWSSGWSHNGYHDILLGGGTIAGVFLFLYLWFGTRAINKDAPLSSIPRLLMASYILTAATQESFFIGSHFLWALLAATFFPFRTEDRSIKK